MKTISSTRITSINGVTLISCVSARSSSPWSRRTAMGSVRRLGEPRTAALIEIAADDPHKFGRTVRHKRPVAADGARKGVVNHHGGNGGNKAEAGGEQCFCNARRDNREVGRLCLRNADKAVHDAPDRAEQADKGSSGAD